MENCENIHNGTAKQFLLLTIKNETTSRLEVSFKRNTWYNGICSSCDSSSSENTIEVTIEPNSELKGECDANNGLRIFSKMLNLNNVRQLTHYELVDVIVHEAD
ncbi:MAG: hypothetical protein K9J17_08775 [Flavobacteriales bacterium]|nr:hypothetical protein [Flavobacteriales bacterium]